MDSPNDDDIEVARVEAILAARLGLSGPAPATRIGRYAVLDRLGAGAMGVVYRAYDDRLERPIAIKLVHAELDSPSLRERLHREARSMAKLSSAHVASVFEFGDHDGRSFVAMELVRGQSMRRWQHDTQRPWPEVVAAYLQAARGLAAAHAAGVIHRDFKPDNAVIDEHGLVKVLDFGLARTSTLDDTPTLEAIEAPPTDDAVAPTPIVLERAVGPDHPHLASQLDNLAMNLVDGDEPERGRALHARALAIFEKTLGPDHSRTALAMLGIARADRRLGRQADALAPAERALAIQERAAIGAEWTADTQFVLARILWEAPVDRGRDRDRAAQLARRARDTYRGMVGQAKELALTETWLREQGLDSSLGADIVR